MGLFDRFRRHRDGLQRIERVLEQLVEALSREPDEPVDLAPTKQDWLRIGRLEAEVESLELKWQSHKEETRKLMQRIEKRDERAAKREEAAEVAARETNGDPVEVVADPITQRVLARRRRLGAYRKEE